MRIEKTDFEGLVKDPSSGAVLNVDNAKLEAYKKQKNAMSMTVNNNERIMKNLNFYIFYI